MQDAPLRITIKAMDDEIKHITERMQEVSEEIAKAKAQLKNDLALSWPEILAMDVFTPAMLRFLAQFASPDEVLAASGEELGSAICGLSASEIRNYAVGSRGASGYADLVRDSAEEILFLEKREKSLNKALAAHELRVHKKEMEILLSIPGVEEETAAVFMAEVEDISRFATYQKLIAYIGTDPSQSRRGNEKLKNCAYEMAQQAVSASSYFSASYDKKTSEGFSGRKAMTAVVNKLMKLIFTLLARGEMYKEEVTPTN